MAIKVLFTAHGTAAGGRNGHIQADDGLISVDLSIPKSMGGPGRPNTSTPEHLFAAGYAACFGSGCREFPKPMPTGSWPRVTRSAPNPVQSKVTSTSG